MTARTAPAPRTSRRIPDREFTAHGHTYRVTIERKRADHASRSDRYVARAWACDGRHVLTRVAADEGQAVTNLALAVAIRLAPAGHPIRALTA
jgi:hypothetical protein